MGRISEGFTFIEMAIAVAIIGILAAVSIPLYQGYVVKTQVNRAASELAQYRAPVEEAMALSAPLTNDAIGYLPSEITTGDLATDVAAFSPDGSGHL